LISGNNPNAWRDVRLGDLCEHVTVGHVGKMSDQYVDRGVPLLRSQDIGPFKLALEHAKRVSPEFHARLRKSALVGGDVVVVRTGYPGTAAVVPPSVGELNCADLVVIRPGPQLDPWFLAAHFNSRHGRALVRGQLVGSAQQHFNVGVAANMQLSLPDLMSQRRIGAVARSFTELIEVNERRIKLLEDLARSLFREWFVHFRFPGHDHVELVDSKLGRIPDGWTVSCLDEIADVIIEGVDPSQLEPTSSYVGLEHLPRRHTTLRDWGSVESVSSRKLLFSRGDTLFGKIRPYFHKVAWAPFDAAASSDTIVLRAHPDRALTAFVNTVASSDELVAEAVATSNGTKMPRADPKALLAYELPLPDEDLLLQFECTVRRWLEWSSELVQQNRQLAATRDLLLPRLVSGRLDMSDIGLGVLSPTEVE
jgi:type I restriction enzyme S subunit